MVFCGEGTVAKLTNEHSAELSDLSNQQTKALTDAIFVGMTAEQWSDLRQSTRPHSGDFARGAGVWVESSLT
jgi:hypothetical protein